MKSKGRIDLGAYAFILPALIIYLSVIIVPTVYSFVLSLYKWKGVGTKTFVGLRNYITLFTKDSIFLTALKNNIIWIILTLVFMMTIALLLAVLLNKSFKGRTFFRGMFYFPYVLSLIVVALVWNWIYNPTTGFINGFLKLIGLGYLQGNWTADPKISLYCVFVAACWQGIGQPMILFLAGLQTVSVDVLEAAKIDGASKIRTFFVITVPLMKETFIIVIATLIISAMKVYDIIAGMTGGGPSDSTQTLATYMYSQTFMYNNVGMGTTIACIMFLMMLVIIVPYIMFTARED